MKMIRGMSVALLLGATTLVGVPQKPAPKRATPFTMKARAATKVYGPAFVAGVVVGVAAPYAIKGCVNGAHAVQAKWAARKAVPVTADGTDAAATGAAANDTKIA